MIKTKKYVLRLTQCIVRIQRNWRAYASWNSIWGAQKRVLSFLEQGKTDAALHVLRSKAYLIPLRLKKHEYKTLLHFVASIGNVSAAKFLVRHDRSIISARDLEDNTAIHIAAASGQLDMIKFLADKVNEATSEHFTGNEEGESKLPNSVDQNGVAVHAGPLRKRRETSRWMARWVVLRTSPPALHYYKSRKASQNGPRYV